MTFNDIACSFNPHVYHAWPRCSFTRMEGTGNVPVQLSGNCSMIFAYSASNSKKLEYHQGNRCVGVGRWLYLVGLIINIQMNLKKVQREEATPISVAVLSWPACHQQTSFANTLRRGFLIIVVFLMHRGSATIDFSCTPS